MHDDHLVDLPDEQYRAHWLAFRDAVDWAAHRDMTGVPIMFDGPDALYRRNKGSFMERLQPAVHCRLYAGHARRARRTGAWIPEEKVFEASLVPALDLTPPRTSFDVMRVIRWLFPAPAPYEALAQPASPSSSRLASTP